MQRAQDAQPESPGKPATRGSFPRPDHFLGDSDRSAGSSHLRLSCQHQREPMPSHKVVQSEVWRSMPRRTRRSDRSPVLCSSWGPRAESILSKERKFLFLDGEQDWCYPEHDYQIIWILIIIIRGNLSCITPYITQQVHINKQQRIEKFFFLWCQSIWRKKLDCLEICMIYFRV